MRKITALLAAVSLTGLLGSTVFAGEACETAAKSGSCATECASKTAATTACDSKATATACANKATANLKLNNIKCGDCASKAETALMQVKGVTSAHVCPESHVASVEFDKTQTSERKIAAAAKKAGFKATRVKS